MLGLIVDLSHENCCESHLQAFAVKNGGGARAEKTKTFQVVDFFDTCYVSQYTRKFPDSLKAPDGLQRA